MLEVRSARPDDAAAMAEVHVLAWQETYRGLMRDAVLDAEDAVERRTRMWDRILADDSGIWRSAVAVDGGHIVGLSLTGPPEEDADSGAKRRLAAIYLLREHHGSGAGSALLDAVLDPEESAVLWVADPNPRSQAFYAKAGFRPDGRSADDDGLRTVRMVRRAAGG